MSIKDKRRKLSEAAYDDSDSMFDSPPSRDMDSKRIRRIHPLGPRVVVRIMKGGNMTETGLYLPEGAKQAMHDSILAEVVEVASAVDSNTEEETNVSGVPLGALVLIAKTVGVRVPWDEDLRIVDTREVLAVVDEIAII